MGNLKNFVGEYAYNIIKNTAVDDDAIRKALVTPQNARDVFSELTEFEIKSLCFEISSSGAIGQITKTTQEEIIEAFASVGYDKIIFDDEKAISECAKYYRQGEVICTYNNLRSRMREYHMLVAVKKDIDKIERPTNPSRDDEYGTSVLNIQIARNGSHMSIKNRYNHTVSEPDSTFNNNLDRLYFGLQSMVLGYYGFASLNNKKSFYKNITNIGGVYLKYHTEKENVYFGSFVLDGVNGVRFADAGRYYVTGGKYARNLYEYYPLVLDFKDKKAIDLYRNERNANKKTPLMSRALREGVLTSANKNEAYTVTAVFQDAKKELLQSNKNALKYLHELYGYDFTQPHKITGFLGKFTAKNIEKATGHNEGTLLVCVNDYLKVCEMADGRFYAKDLRGNYSYRIDKFYRQGDFEDKRKNGNLAAYVIQQDKQCIGEPKPETRSSSYYGRNEKPEIDKSGCNVTEARSVLSCKLRQYKTAKRAKEAAEIDYKQDILEVDKSFADLKAKMIAKLTQAETSEDYRKVADVMDSWLVWLVRDISTIKKSASNMSFTSVESARKMISDAKATIAKKHQALE